MKLTRNFYFTAYKKADLAIYILYLQNYKKITLIHKTMFIKHFNCNEFKIFVFHFNITMQ